MKKTIILAMLLMLLLCGCGVQKAAETTEGIQILPTQQAGEAVVPEEGDIVIPLG